MHHIMMASQNPYQGDFFNQEMAQSETSQDPSWMIKYICDTAMEMAEKCEDNPLVAEQPEEAHVLECDTPLSEIFNILIPNEITTLIFKRLDLQSQRSARSVCKKWLKLVDPLFIWKPKLCDASSSAVLTFARKGHTLDALVIGKLQDFTYPSRGIGFTSVKSLTFPSAKVSSSVGISDTILNNLLFEYRYVEKLSLHSSHFQSIQLPSHFRAMNFPMLTSLEIYALDENQRGFFVCADTFYQTFPNLSSISITLEYQRDTILHQNPPFYKEIFQFVLKHGKTLTNFCLNFRNLSDERSLPPYVFDLDHGIPARDYQEIVRGLGEVARLQEFSFEPSFYEGRSRYNFATELMNKQTELTTLNLVNLSRLNFAVYSSALEIIRRCSATLKKIDFDGCFCPEARPLDQFSCHILQNCKNLVEFRISICGLKIIDVDGLPAQIQVIHLGQGLCMSQINYITSTLTNLREWYLPQDRGQYDRRIPKTSVNIFKLAVKMPKLEKLILTKRCSSWKRIRKVISYTQGLDIAEKESSSNANKDPLFVKIIIDRNRVELDRL